MTSYLLPYISDILSYIFIFFMELFKKKTIFDFFYFFRKEKKTKDGKKMEKTRKNG